MTGYPVKDGTGNVIVGGDIGADQVNKPGLRSVWKTSFSDVGASPYVDDLFNIICRGAGQSVSQSGGNLLIASGTAVNEETIIRSKRAFNESFVFSYAAILSQRIVNNTFAVELVDVVGDDLPLVINSAVSVTVTFPTGRNPFSAKNVGQSMYMGNFKGTAAMIPGRYSIASVAGDTVTFTVAGFPAAGQGSVSLYGWNYYHVLYDGTVNTNAKFDAQRNGWNTGDTTATINQTASPGHLALVRVEDRAAIFADMLQASLTSVPQDTIRSTRVSAIPDNGTPLFVQFRATNGSVAPASTTTFTIGFAEVMDYTPEYVSLVNNANSSPLVFSGVNTQTVGTALGVIGARAHDGTDSSFNQPVKIGANARSTNVTAVADNDVANIISDLIGRIVVANGAVEQLKDRNRITLTTTTETTLIAAVASVRHVLTGLTIANRDNVAHTLDIRDATSGTIRETVVLPAGQTFVYKDTIGNPQAAVNTNWTVTMREVATTAVEISAASYRVNY